MGCQKGHARGKDGAVTVEGTISRGCVLGKIFGRKGKEKKNGGFTQGKKKPPLNPGEVKTLKPVPEATNERGLGGGGSTLKKPRLPAFKRFDSKKTKGKVK